MAQIKERGNPLGAQVVRLLILLWATIYGLPQSRSDFVRYEDSRVSMACTYSIVVYGSDESQLRQIVNDAFDEVDRIDRLMSHYKKDSPLSQINREAAHHPVRTDSELYSFLLECVRYSRASQGAFDITVGPLMKAWGFFRGEGKMPSDVELKKIRQTIGYQHLIFNTQEKTIAFDRAGVELDLGGIAKGYAVDQVVTLLKSCGIASALISAGGSTLYALGSPPDRDCWEVEIQDPTNARKMARRVQLKDQSLSVSGSAEKFFEFNGQRYSHIMDPRTGRPVQGVLSVAVITETGTAGDALDNVFYVQGVARSRKYLQQLSDTEVFLFLPDKAAPWKLVHLKKYKR